MHICIVELQLMLIHFDLDWRKGQLPILKGVVKNLALLQLSNRCSKITKHRQKHMWFLFILMLQDLWYHALSNCICRKIGLIYHVISKTYGIVILSLTNLKTTTGLSNSTRTRHIIYFAFGMRKLHIIRIKAGIALSSRQC